MARSSTTWKKGQVTNPKGRPPKNRELTEATKELLRATEIKMSFEVDGEVKEFEIKSKHTMAQALTATLLKLGLMGNLGAIQEIWTRVEGKPLSVPDVEKRDEIADMTDDEKREAAQNMVDYLQRNVLNGKRKKKA